MGTNQPPAADARPLQVRVNLPFSKGLITHVKQPSGEEINLNFLVSSAPDVTFLNSVLQKNPGYCVCMAVGHRGEEKKMRKNWMLFFC